MIKILEGVMLFLFMLFAMSIISSCGDIDERDSRGAVKIDEDRRSLVRVEEINTGSVELRGLLGHKLGDVLSVEGVIEKITMDVEGHPIVFFECRIIQVESKKLDVPVIMNVWFPRYLGPPPKLGNKISMDGFESGTFTGLTKEAQEMIDDHIGIFSNKDGEFGFRSAFHALDK